jgi:hypothetical protein
LGDIFWTLRDPEEIKGETGSAAFHPLWGAERLGSCASSVLEGGSVSRSLWATEVISVAARCCSDELVDDNKAVSLCQKMRNQDAFRL